MSTASFDNLQVLLQMIQATRNLARDMHQNAVTWLAAAQAGNPDQSTLAKWMQDAGVSYRNIIAQATSFIAANNATATAACGLIGATVADLQAYAAPLSNVANGLGTADLSTYTAIETACNQIIAAVPMPPTLWPGV